MLLIKKIMWEQQNRRVCHGVLYSYIWMKSLIASVKEVCLLNILVRHKR